MALSGLNVTFGWIVASPPAGASGGYSQGPAPIYGPSSDSQLLSATGGTTTKVSTKGPIPTYLTSVSLVSSVDMWVTVGPNPADPSADQPVGGRTFVPEYVAGTTPFQSIDILCNPGDKVRCSPA